MNEITENVSLEMTNVLTYRGKVTQQQMTVIAKEMNDIITANKANKTISGVSATYEIINPGVDAVMDVEIMYPLDKHINVSSPYKVKPIFRLRNAVKIRHEGRPDLLQNSANKLIQYINEKGLMPITVGYNVTVHEPQSPVEIDSLVVDLYIGVCDNIL
ncbi:MAG: AraC family transcriptional regulator [Ruminococcus sp.]|nr:AraC family transcriptional regulator [Ruminococcus sp.]